jgi:U6 snRNA-associated Sm-like protein LSm7
MSERGNFRGGGRGGGGRGRGGGDRGGRGGGGAGNKDGGERKKENILDLNKYMDKAMTVKFNGGREGESGVECVGFAVGM